MKNKLFVLFCIFKFVCHDFELFFLKFKMIIDWSTKSDSIFGWPFGLKKMQKKDVLKNTQNKLKISKRRMLLKSWNLKCSKDCSNDYTNDFTNDCTKDACKKMHKIIFCLMNLELEIFTYGDLNGWNLYSNAKSITPNFVCVWKTDKYQMLNVSKRLEDSFEGVKTLHWRVEIAKKKKKILRKKPASNSKSEIMISLSLR